MRISCGNSTAILLYRLSYRPRRLHIVIFGCNTLFDWIVKIRIITNIVHNIWRNLEKHLQASALRWLDCFGLRGLFARNLHVTSSCLARWMALSNPLELHSLLRHWGLFYKRLCFIIILGKVELRKQGNKTVVPLFHSVPQPSTYLHILWKFVGLLYARENRKVSCLHIYLFSDLLCTF